jgi:hypothetical protein
MEYTSPVLLTVFRTNCHTHVLITSRKQDLCTDEEPKDKKGEIYVFVGEMVVLDKFHRGLSFALVGHYYGVNKLICFNKNEDKFWGSIRTSVPSSGKICVSCCDLVL